jgi:Fur family ferric uptake transcriptional regulator
MIRAKQARVTRPRVEVLAALLAAGSALTHHELARRINRGLGVNRVTIYRVLEWLTSHDLAHKIAGDDRIWRFNAATGAPESGHDHAHFECSHCGEVICLAEPAAVRDIRLPSGYRRQGVQLTVKGLCAECVPARRHF